MDIVKEMTDPTRDEKYVLTVWVRSNSRYQKIRFFDFMEVHPFLDKHFGIDFNAMDLAFKGLSSKGYVSNSSIGDCIVLHNDKMLLIRNDVYELNYGAGSAISETAWFKEISAEIDEVINKALNKEKGKNE